MLKLPKKQKQVKAERPVLYPKLEIEVCRGDKAITADTAKKILGWEEVGDKQAQFVDRLGKGIACWNNVRNRPFKQGLCETYMQKHLKRKWKFNGETIIIGTTGMALSCQHRLISLIWADQEWSSGKNKLHWQEECKTPPTLECIVVKGISEEDDVVNTLDNVLPRSLDDVLYLSKHFRSLPDNDRQKISKMASHCIKLLWQRTGALKDAFSPYRTHDESVNFLDRHMKIVECCKHIYEEDKNSGIRPWLSPGYASALLYLMGSGTSDVDKYRADGIGNANESTLDWSNWAKACKFWVLMAKGNDSLLEIRHGIAGLAAADGSSTASPEERLAVFSKAWVQYVQGHDITAKDVKLTYGTDDDGNHYLNECPTVGGIDLGDGGDHEEADVEETPDEESAKQEERRKKAEDLAAKIKAKRDTTRQPGEVAKPEPKATGPDGKPLPIKALRQPLNKGNGQATPAFAEPAPSPKIRPGSKNSAKTKEK